MVHEGRPAAKSADGRRMQNRRWRVRLLSAAEQIENPTQEYGGLENGHRGQVDLDFLGEDDKHVRASLLSVDPKTDKKPMYPEGIDRLSCPYHTFFL